MGNFNFSYFLQLTWEFLGIESERGGSICWPNNKIIDRFASEFGWIVLETEPMITAVLSCGLSLVSVGHRISTY